MTPGAPHWFKSANPTHGDRIRYTRAPLGMTVLLVLYATGFAVSLAMTLRMLSQHPLPGSPSPLMVFVACVALAMAWPLVVPYVAAADRAE